MQPERETETKYSFGSFELDPASRLLTRSGEIIALAPKTFDLLLLMLESNGRVLTKSELMRALWQDVFVEETNLSFQISTLRKALGQEAAVWIETAPKVGYRLNVPVERRAAARVQSASVPTRRWHPLFWAAAATLPVLLALIWLRVPGGTSLAPLDPIPLTSYEGVESQPSFSPDGSQVAFIWNEGNQDTIDIYVKTIGSEPPLRLTTDGEQKCGPAWSPDGRYITFQRRSGIHLIPPTGGPERKLVSEAGFSCQISWSPDGKYLAFSRLGTESDRAGIFITALDGVPRRLTSAEWHGTHRSPAFSPDGRSLAYVSCTGAAGNCTSITVLALDDQLNAHGAPLLVTPSRRALSTISWTEDGDALVFAANVHNPRLYRVSLRHAEPKLLSFAGAGVQFPAVSRTGNRMSYSRSPENIELWEMENGVLTRSPLSSTFRDTNPQFSPDGKRIAFPSNRSGILEIWGANADGSGAVQLTHSKGSGTPRWSPDARWIVYDTEDEDGRFDINVVDAAGGPPRPLVRHPADDGMASFSRDGKSVYFFSSRNGRNEIYRVPAAGGEPVRVTDRGGVLGFESADGKSLYYTKQRGDRCDYPLFVRSLAGGPERQVLDSVCERAFQVTDDGIYYAVKSAQEGTVTVRLYDPASGTSRDIRQAKGRLYGSFAMAVSPDRNTILLTGSAQTGSDLYLVENFR